MGERGCHRRTHDEKSLGNNSNTCQYRSDSQDSCGLTIKRLGTSTEDDLRDAL